MLAEDRCFCELGLVFAAIVADGRWSLCGSRRVETVSSCFDWSRSRVRVERVVRGFSLGRLHEEQSAVHAGARCAALFSPGWEGCAERDVIFWGFFQSSADAVRSPAHYLPPPTAGVSWTYTEGGRRPWLRAVRVIWRTTGCQSLLANSETCQ